MQVCWFIIIKCKLLRITGLWQFVRCNVGANYKENSLNIMMLCLKKLVSWSKHVFKAVILPSHWSCYMQKQVIGGQSGKDRHTFHPITRHCTIKMIQHNNIKSELFLHNVASFITLYYEWWCSISLHVEQLALISKLPNQMPYAPGTRC